LTFYVSLFTALLLQRQMQKFQMKL